MSNSKTTTLDEAIAAARKLPADTQAAVAAELMECVEDLSAPDRQQDRHDIIKERLAKPLEAISRDEFMAMLRQYNPGL